MSTQSNGSATDHRGGIETVIKERSIDFDKVNSLGKGWQLIGGKPSMRKLTKKLAMHFHEALEKIPGERNLLDRHTDYLRGEMERGTFHFEHVQLVKANLKGTWYRLNGQHTCWARMEANEALGDYNKPVMVYSYEVKSMEDMRNLYSVIDRNKGRTKSHVIIAQLASYGGWRDIKEASIKQVADGLPIFLWEQKKERKKHEEREIAYLLQTSHQELGTDVGSFLTDLQGKTNFLTRAPVVASMLGTFEASSRNSTEFWTAVHTGDNMASSDPRKKLREFLKDRGVSDSAGSNSKQADKVTREYMYRVCVKMWNAWMDNNERAKAALVKSAKLKPRDKYVTVKKRRPAAVPA